MNIKLHRKNVLRSSFLIAATAILCAGEVYEEDVLVSFPLNKFPAEFSAYAENPRNDHESRGSKIKETDAAYQALHELLIKEKTGWHSYYPIGSGMARFWRNRFQRFQSPTMRMTCLNNGLSNGNALLEVIYLIKTPSSAEINDGGYRLMSEPTIYLFKEIDGLCPDFYSMLPNNKE